MALYLLVFAFIPTLLLCSTIAQSSSSPQYSNVQLMYVTPNKNIPCVSVTRYLLSPCFTIGEYASKADTYFVNDSTFFFYPGDHMLDISLTLTHIHNITLTSLPYKIANIAVLSDLASICNNLHINDVVIIVQEVIVLCVVFKLIVRADLERPRLSIKSD